MEKQVVSIGEGNSVRSLEVERKCICCLRPIVEGQEWVEVAGAEYSFLVHKKCAGRLVDGGKRVLHFGK